MRCPMSDSSPAMVDGQPVDPRPGFYYVTVRRPKAGGGFEFRPLRGPFENDHAAAIRALPAARKEATDMDPKAQWYTFGIARCTESQGLGIFDILDRRATGREPGHNKGFDGTVKGA